VRQLARMNRWSNAVYGVIELTLFHDKTSSMSTSRPKLVSDMFMKFQARSLECGQCCRPSALPLPKCKMKGLTSGHTKTSTTLTMSLQPHRCTYVLSLYAVRRSRENSPHAVLCVHVLTYIVVYVRYACTHFYARYLIHLHVPFWYAHDQSSFNIHPLHLQPPPPLLPHTPSS
jgi:hypothetical protein